MCQTHSGCGCTLCNIEHCDIALTNRDLDLTSSTPFLQGRVIVSSVYCFHSEISWDICTIYAPASRERREVFFTELLALPFFSSLPPNFLLGDFNVHHDDFHLHPLLQCWLQSHTVDSVTRDQGRSLPTFRSLAYGTRHTIDYIFSSPILIPLTSEPKHTYASDFSDDEMVAIRFSPQPATPLGKGEWRLNISFMDDPMFTTVINHVLDQLAYQHDHSFAHVSKQEKWGRTKHKIKNSVYHLALCLQNLRRKNNNSKRSDKI